MKHIFLNIPEEKEQGSGYEDQVPDQIKAARSAELLELNRRSRRFMKKRRGTTGGPDRGRKSCVMERNFRSDTKEYVKIGVKNPNNLINQLVNVEIENQLQILH